MSDSPYTRWLTETIALRDAAVNSLNELAARLERPPQQMDADAAEALLDFRRQSFRAPDYHAGDLVPDLSAMRTQIDFALLSVRHASERFLPLADDALRAADFPCVVRVSDFGSGVQIITRDRDDPPDWKCWGHVRSLAPSHHVRRLFGADDLAVLDYWIVLGPPWRNRFGDRHPRAWYATASVAAFTRQAADARRQEQAREAEQLQRAADDARRHAEDEVRRDLPRRLAALGAELARR